ncbi:MAG: PAS domain S-box protein, partial [Myxococcales bacterium]
MGGEAGAARQLAGLLREGGGGLAAQRVARLVADVCAGADSIEAVRLCAGLRDSLLELLESGALNPAEARVLFREIDAALAAALDALRSSGHALEALERALSESSVRNLPQLVLEGSGAADSAAILIAEGGALVVRASAGLDLPAEAGGPESVARRCLALREAVEDSGCENARGVLALPLEANGEVAAVLRASSRTAWRFGDDERAFLRAIGRRAASLLAGGTARGPLRQALRTFESLVEASPLPIVAIDRDAQVQIWNRAAEELFGWGRDEVMGKPLLLVPAELREEARSIEEEVRAGKIVRNREVRWACRDGARLDLALFVAPLRDSAGAFSGAISILADISDRKRREEEAVLTARFREHLLGIVSHDLRNPLTAIVTSAQLLLR